MSGHFAFVTFYTPDDTTLALGQLNGRLLRGNPVKLHRPKQYQEEFPQSVPLAMSMMAAMPAPAYLPCPVLQISNMLTEKDMASDEAFADIKEDLAEDITEFGAVVSMEVRPPDAPV